MFSINTRPRYNCCSVADMADMVDCGPLQLVPREDGHQTPAAGGAVLPRRHHLQHEPRPHVPGGGARCDGRPHRQHAQGGQQSGGSMSRITCSLVSAGPLLFSCTHERARTLTQALIIASLCFFNLFYLSVFSLLLYSLHSLLFFCSLLSFF